MRPRGADDPLMAQRLMTTGSKVTDELVRRAFRRGAGGLVRNVSGVAGQRRLDQQYGPTAVLPSEYRALPIAPCRETQRGALSRPRDLAECLMFGVWGRLM